jgi:hypothetical protein
MPENYRICWMARNEDFFALRWSEPDFVRQHIALNGQPYVGGYFLGSECYIPAKDHMTRPELDRPWRWAFQRQWLYYMTWGRLLYDPETPDDVFAAACEARYGPAGRELFAALKWWDELIRVTDPVYVVMPLAHLHHENRTFHWKLLRPQVVRDIALAKQLDPAESGDNH